MRIGEKRRSGRRSSRPAAEADLFAEIGRSEGGASDRRGLTEREPEVISEREAEEIS